MFMQVYTVYAQYVSNTACMDEDSTKLIRILLLSLEAGPRRSLRFRIISRYFISANFETPWVLYVSEVIESFSKGMLVPSLSYSFMLLSAVEHF
jgi:hypothetical protein